jgi:hypothetical protein
LTERGLEVGVEMEQARDYIQEKRCGEEKEGKRGGFFSPFRGYV